MHTHDNRHLLAVALACAIWGGSVIGTKLSYDSLAPMSLGLVRFSLSAALLFAHLALRRQLERPSPRDLALIATTGLLGITLYFAAENYGASLASGATSSLVIGSFPAMTLVMECLADRTPPHPRIATGIAVSLAGVAVLALGDLRGNGTSELLGIAFLMLAGLSWGIYNLMMRSLAGRYSPVVITTWQTLFGALGFVPLALLEGSPIRHMSGVAMASLAYLVVFCTIAGFSLYNYGFERLSPTVAASLVNLTPVVGLALSAIVLREHISIPQLAGGTIVVAGILLSTLPEQREG